MAMYPVFLKLKDKECLVVGGGKVALRKVHGLLAAGARVTVIAPRLETALRDMTGTGKIASNERPYRSEDLTSCAVVIAATDSAQVNHRIFRDAQNARILANVVDDPEHCDFYVPSIVKRGDLQVAISTSGKAPLFAKRLRKFLERILYPGLDEDLGTLGEERKRAIQSSCKTGEARHEDVRRALAARIAEIMRRIEQA
ncbi:MAG: siroheme synthase [Spirochaetales bacterium]|nr:siroheme synthase [Spirochaetales bacterium]